MKDARWTPRVLVLLLTMGLLSCVTINIYFPAEQVEKAAEDIVGEIRKQSQDQEKPPAKPDKESSLPWIHRWIFSVRSAYAAQETVVSNAAIRQLKSRLARHDSQLSPYFQRGVLGEGADGYVVILNAGALSIKERAALRRLVNMVNADRRALYEEVARALNVNLNQVGRIAQVFAKEWQRTARQGWFIQTPDGNWRKK